jgi:exodeoxyribonuclease VII small subunit
MPEPTAPPKSDVAAYGDIGTMSFEDALNELEKIVRQIEDGRGKLDEAITAYERGVALKRHCESKLKEAQTKIEQITVGDNAIGTTAFGG